MTERWKPVPEWEGLYEVSSEGRVRSLHWSPPRICKAALNGYGYPRVILSDKATGRKVYRTVHVLMLAAFVGPRPHGFHTRHLDGIKTHNTLANLTYGTPEENSADALALGENYWARQTHCPQGHEYTPENTRLVPGWKDGKSRRCVTCRRAQHAAGERRRRAERSAA